MLKLSEVKLKNIKCFSDVTISFDKKKFSVIAGDNGSGKTTILRAIAMGLCDEAGTSGLWSELESFVRAEEEGGEIEVTFDTGKKVTKVFKETQESRSVEQENRDSTYLKDVFVAGYGAGSSGEGTTSFKEYAPEDSVYTLFNYGARLQNAELCYRRLIESDKSLKDSIDESLKRILMKEDIQIGTDKKGFFFSEQDQQCYLNSMSDGYRVMTNTFLDFISWSGLFHNYSSGNLADISGIFIIDEIEKHLHPSWQRKICKTLSEVLPNVQFIASTHSPICALGVGDFEDSQGQLIKTQDSEENSYKLETIDIHKDFNSYRVDQILASRIFDFVQPRNKNTEDAYKQYIELKNKNNKRNSEENKRFLELEKKLKNMPLWNDITNKEAIEKLERIISFS